MDSKSTFCASVEKFVANEWETNALPALEDFVRIPNTSPEFNGSPADALKAAQFMKAYVDKQEMAGCTADLRTCGDKTPMLVITIDGTDGSNDTVLSYGHMDKQPGLGGWSVGGPTDPVRVGDKLYGRGAVDDGYSMFAYITALKALKAQGTKHCRMVITMEAGEESGSPDMIYWLDQLKDHIGTNVSLVICLDSGCGNYDQLWITPSLRGMMAGDLKVSMLREQLHSGEGSGVIADTARVHRMLLNRVEDVNTGYVTVPETHCVIPEAHQNYVDKATCILKEGVFNEMPLLAGIKPVTDDCKQLLMNQLWEPTMTVIANDHGSLPPLPGSNIIRTETNMRLSFRLPPCVVPEKALEAVKATLLKEPLPYGAKVTFENTMMGSGWASNSAAGGWLETSITDSSTTFFGKAAAFKGMGGSIPIINDFQGRYTDAEIIVSGVAGPQSNMHAVNETLDVPAVKKLTSAFAKILADHAENVAKRS
eukprot:125601_1